MILRQLFDFKSCTYTYLVGSTKSNTALLIDPVKGNTDQYIGLLAELGLELKIALDTHVHADHITALGKLKELTSCTTMIAKESQLNCDSAPQRISDKQVIALGELELNAIYTPGHTDDSYSFHLQTDCKNYLFSGDTLLIRATGRTDFQNGSADRLYDSLFNKLLLLDKETIVLPGHDYKGWTRSTIGEEIAHNSRLQKTDKRDFITMMGNLDLPKPRHIDIAVPANQQCGKTHNIHATNL